jgi:peptidoglycan/xylan/chitin deacetylase (PgdA/CDA1 family)
MSNDQYGSRVGVFEILRLFRRRNVRTTFFVPTAIAELHTDAIKTIHDDGHEIALHGHDHERPDTLTAEQETSILRKSLDILTKPTGTQPIGYRAPWAGLSASTIGILADHGVQYDTTLMDDVFPYFHRVHGKPDVLELPIHWTLDDWSYSMNSPAALPQPVQNPIATPDHIVACWAGEVKGIVNMGGLACQISHPQVTGRPGRLQTLDRLIGIVQEESGIWLTGGQEINNYWRRSKAVAPTAGERLSR